MLHQNTPVTFEQFITACQEGGIDNTNIVSRYIMNNRDNPRKIYQCDQEGNNALTYASAYGQREIFQIILTALDIRDVLISAVLNNSELIYYMLEEYVTLDMLTQKNRQGQTIIQEAANLGCDQIAVSLLALEAKLRTAPEQKVSPVVTKTSLTPQEELDAIQFKGEIPDHLTCFLLAGDGRLMTCPTTVNGHTYEYKKIKTWSDTEPNRDDETFTCPYTRCRIPHSEIDHPTDEKNIEINKKIKQEILDFVEKAKAAKIASSTEAKETVSAKQSQSSLKVTKSRASLFTQQAEQKPVIPTSRGTFSSVFKKIFGKR